ncbi:pilus assembly protein TadG-related protein [Microbacterium sp. KR10-403]|uniref:pilus assembly protein TadG-related protein n=1 Tax=Microbacterium sp. KR10-403 TaxID=3158581 RepID=UPI0032E3F02D
MTRPQVAVIARMRARIFHVRTDDEGSILPLAIGYAMLALILILICADATSMYLAQKRLDALADAAALAGAEGYVITSDGPDAATARLTTDGVRDQAAALVADVGGGAVLVAATTPDGASARVQVRDAWHPPVLTVFVPQGITLTATATSRTALH